MDQGYGFRVQGTEIYSFRRFFSARLPDEFKLPGLDILGTITKGLIDSKLKS